MHAHVASVDVVGTRDLIRHIAELGVRLSARRRGPRLNRQHSLVLGALFTAPSQIVPAQVLPHGRPPAPVLIDDDEPRGQLPDGVLEATIEEWKASLDPAPPRLVRRSFDGHAHIRSAAGIGKTFVGLGTWPQLRAEVVLSAGGGTHSD